MSSAKLGIKFGDEINIDPSSWDDVPEEATYFCVLAEEERNFLLGAIPKLEIHRKFVKQLACQTAVIDGILNEAYARLNLVSKRKEEEE